MAAASRRKPPENEIFTRPLNLQSKRGTSGAPIQLKANYFKLKSKTDWCIFQYAVDITPSEDRLSVRKGLLRQFKDQLGAYLFDGTSLYVSTRLPQPLELNSFRESDRQPINIKVRLVGDLVRGDYHYLHFFNIIVRKCLEHLQLQMVGRNYYDALSKIEVREYKLEVWPGYITSIRQHEHEVLMCAEISHKVMRMQTTHDILYECYNKNQAFYKKDFSREIIGLVVLTTYNNRTYKIDDVDYSKKPSDTFKMHDGSSISYAQYYKQKYQITLRDMKQPLLVSRSKARDRRAGSDELIYLIPELCRNTGLTDNMKSDFRLMKALSEHTRVAPSLRMQKLLTFNRRLQSKPEIIQEFTQWNFNPDTELVNLPGRVFPPESIIYGNNKATQSKNADWNFELQKNTCISTCPLKDWLAFSPAKFAAPAKAFIEHLVRAGAKMKFAITKPRFVEIPDDRADTYNNVIKHYTDQSMPQLILCIVSNNQEQRYAAIKKKLCIDRPIPSQVMLSKNLFQKSDSMMVTISHKIALQINCKLGGIPWTVAISKYLPGLMVVGFDVCHDKSAGGQDFGAMVASLDQNFGRYFSAVSKHSSGEELSNDMALNLGRALEQFRNLNSNRLPAYIIIYRDGVGEGDIPFVYNFEVTQIKKKLTEIYGGPGKFRLGFVIVTKRINTRLFLNNNNPPPGTVVDDIITDPLKYDFFIISQKVNQGTVAPTAYNVIEDSTGLSPDKMQLLTFKFCHMYFNYSGTVRLPAPCQYAHKLAFFVSKTLRQAPHHKLQNLLYFL